MIKFLHIADLHLERPFEGVTGFQPEFSQPHKKTTEKLLANILEVAQKQAVDFIILAGDTFHQKMTTLKTQQSLNSFFEALKRSQIAVFLSFGNHDYYNQNDFWFEFPENVYFWDSEQVESLTFETKTNQKVVLSSFSYTDRWLNAEKVLEFPKKNPQTEDYHIGIYHGQEGTLQDNYLQHYAPFSVRDLQAKNYDYWALGHIHVPQILDRDKRIIYAGTPQGHSRKETDVKGVVLVTLTKQHVASEWLPVASLKYQTCQWDFTHLTRLENLNQALIAKLDLLLDQEKEQQYIVQLDLLLPQSFKEEVQLRIDSGELKDYLERNTNSTRLAISKLRLLSEEKNDAKIMLPLSKQVVEKELMALFDYEHFKEITTGLIDHRLFSAEVELSADFLTEIYETVRTNLDNKLLLGGENDSDQKNSY